jgi:dTDP-glucose 4,6-dehydratase
MQPLPVYGTGENVRDWLFVEDHAEAVWKVLNSGKRGEVYNIGGSCEKRNLDLLHLIIDEIACQCGENPATLRQLITFVKDRPGHDFRYGLDCSKIRQELGWSPRHTLAEGLKKTVSYYLICPSSV